MNNSTIKRLQNGDATALEEVRAEYGNKIYGHALRVVKDPWDAEEVAQDVLWTVFRKADSLQDAAAFNSWLFRVTRNASLMHLRKRRNVVPLDHASLEMVMDNAEQRVDGPEVALEAARAVRRLDAAYAELKPGARALFDQVDIAGRSLAEVAEDEGLTMLALKSRLHRVRRKLRHAFDGPLAA
jgi:RNA polymerase sigma-70 factor (ECF subfamily)